MKPSYKIIIAIAWSFAQVIAPSLTGRAGGESVVMAQDAFYIYRNDGDFDGFFFDDVVRMGYSKVDPQGVEHEEYVIQEIETEDSLYRIPLCVIDSIGFQQPDVIFSPKVKHIDESGLIGYIKDFTAYQDKTAFFRINPDAPREIVPEVGDVLVNFSNPSFSYSGQTGDNFSGFACKVTSISQYAAGSQWTVMCDPVTDLADIFMQLISVERLGYDEQGHVKRRVAGFDYDESTRRYVRRHKSGSGSISLFDVSGTLQREWDWGSVSTDINLKAGIDVTYNINWRRIFFKLGRSFGVSLTPSATVKSSRSFEYEITGLPELLSSIKFPAVAPLFQTRPFPKMFLRGGGDLAVKLTLPTVGYNYQETLSFDSDRTFPFDFTMDQGFSNGTSDTQELFNTGDVEISLSGFVQAGTKFTAGVETNDWFSSIMWAYIGLELYAGPKIEGSLSLSTARLLQQGAYESLSDSKIAFHPISLDLEAKARLKLFWQDPDESTFFSGSKQFGSMESYLFPTFKDTQAEFKPQTGAVQCSTDAQRSVFWKSYLGFGAYQNGELKESIFPTTCALGKPAQPYTGRFEALTPGRYEIVPVVKTFDFTLPVKSQSVDVLVTPYLKLTPHDIHFPADGGSASVSIATNAEELSVGVPGMKNMERQWNEHSKTFTIIANPNQSISKAESVVSVSGRTSGVGQVGDAVNITQDPNPGDAIKTVSLVDGSSVLFNQACSVSRNGDMGTITANHSESGDGSSKSYSFSMTIDTSNSSAGKKNPVVASGTFHQTNQYTNDQGTTTEKRDIEFGNVEVDESPVADDDGVHRYKQWKYTVWPTTPTYYRHSVSGPGGSNTQTEGSISVYINNTF